MVDLEGRHDYLLGLVKEYGYCQKDIELIQKAYLFAQIAHGEQKRKSGDPFLIHPLETSIKLIE